MPNKNAAKYVEKMTGGELSSLSQTDPEFYELFCNFAFDEVINEHPLPDRTCHLAILATLLGCGGTDAFSGEVAAALHFGVTAAEGRPNTSTAGFRATVSATTTPARGCRIATAR